jgi:hypothetical protein
MQKALVETGGAFNFVLAVVASHAAPQDAQWQMCHDLSENKFARVHQRSP